MALWLKRWLGLWLLMGLFAPCPTQAQTTQAQTTQAQLAQAQPAQSYIELVRQKTPCPTGGCFDEYLFLSNGIALRKQLDTPDYKGLPRLDIRRINPHALFAATETFSRNSPAKADAPNSAYELFYLKDKRLYIFAADETTVPPELLNIAQMADALFAAGNAATPNFYLHEYHHRVTKAGLDPTHDIHIFSDGTILYSLFHGKTNALLESRLSVVPPDKMKQIHRLVDMALLAPTQPPNCQGAVGLLSWHLEMKKNGKLRQFETCGHDDSDASALFRYLWENFPQDEK